MGKIRRALRWICEGQRAQDELDVALLNYSLENSKNVWRAGLLYMELHTAVDLYLFDQCLPKKWRLFKGIDVQTKASN